MPLRVLLAAGSYVDELGFTEPRSNLTL